jgi:aldose 1-epimerase
VQPDHVSFELALHASEGPMPAIGGWHPWWRRRLTRGEAVRLTLPARAMLRRDGEGIATEEQVTPIPSGPWDDCFTGFDGPPVLRWQGAIELAVESDCEWVVVYDEPVESVCVEPQSGPPDALNRSPAVATPAQPVVVHSSWRWTT